MKRCRHFLNQFHEMKLDKYLSFGIFYYNYMLVLFSYHTNWYAYFLSLILTKMRDKILTLFDIVLRPNKYICTNSFFFSYMI
jgi:hypothetical protein